MCDSAPGGRALPEVLRPAIAGGVQVVQLRDKQLPDDELTAVANAARALCERLGALLIVNDRPLVAREVGADGVHVGQEDMPVAEVRELLGPDMLIGLSTHARDRDRRGRRALRRRRAAGGLHRRGSRARDAHQARAPGRRPGARPLRRRARIGVPFFAIGGLHAGNISEVLAAGASRVVVLRAIAEAEDPERAARELREQLDAHEAHAPEDEVAGTDA